MKTVVSYIHSGVPGISHSYSTTVFNFKIDTVESWNTMMKELEKIHPEAKSSIVVIFMKELQD